jgi:hypothetical protein
MKANQFTVAFHKDISVRELYELLARHYGATNVEVGRGKLVNGLPQDWIVVSNERPKRMD